MVNKTTPNWLGHQIDVFAMETDGSYNEAPLYIDDQNRLVVIDVQGDGEVVKILQVSEPIKRAYFSTDD